MYYTQKDASDEAEKDEDFWIPLLTPLVDENGAEYLAENQIADYPEDLDSLAALHERWEMYLPKEEERVEYYQYGFYPSNKEISGCIRELSKLLDLRAFKSAEHLKELREEVEKGVESIEEQYRPLTGKEKDDACCNLLAEYVIADEIRLLEGNIRISDIMNEILESIPFKTGIREKVIEQLKTVFNNTHLPGNNGNTPNQIVALSNQNKRPEP